MDKDPFSWNQRIPITSSENCIEYLWHQLCPSPGSLYEFSYLTLTKTWSGSKCILNIQTLLYMTLNKIITIFFLRNSWAFPFLKNAERKGLLLYESINIEYYIIQWLKPVLKSSEHDKLWCYSSIKWPIYQVVLKLFS